MIKSEPETVALLTDSFTLKCAGQKFLYFSPLNLNIPFAKSVYLPKMIQLQCKDCLTFDQN